MGKKISNLGVIASISTFAICYCISGSVSWGLVFSFIFAPFFFCLLYIISIAFLRKDRSSLEIEDNSSASAKVPVSQQLSQAESNDPTLHKKNPITNDPLDLQFDIADYDQENDICSTCAKCSGPINDVYFQHDGNVTCTGCRDDLIAKSTAGLPLGRFVSALFYGSITGLFGAALWYAIYLISGYEFALIAIVVGFLVGNAVKSGSGGRGGLLYQCLAVTLTYAAVTLSYFPLSYAALDNNLTDLPDNPNVPQARIIFKKDGSLTVDGKSLDINDAKIATSKVIDDQGYLLICASDLAEPDDGLKTFQQMFGYWVSRNANGAFYSDREFKHKLEFDNEADGGGKMNVFVKIIAAVTICITAPFVSGLENIISFLIIGFALFEAWKINKQTPLLITGPFLIGSECHTPSSEGA